MGAATARRAVGVSVLSLVALWACSGAQGTGLFVGDGGASSSGGNPASSPGSSGSGGSSSGARSDAGGSGGSTSSSSSTSSGGSSTSSSSSGSSGGDGGVGPGLACDVSTPTAATFYAYELFNSPDAPPCDPPGRCGTLTLCCYAYASLSACLPMAK